ncbi:MAG TPA: TrkH family potassium uptake protein [Candidatus Omnitrophota bacterium]|nr:TrkH family potassium uptake protein [Candidatus Omnitrophota bacterium]HPT07170.1 TrkH family potassium uptake protein [Candidatus Omnitrophota bacterium]
MVLKPNLDDIKNICFYLGKIMLGLSLTMLLPLMVGVLFGEYNAALDYLIAGEITAITGLLLIFLCRNDKEMSWMQGMIVVSLTWIVAMLAGGFALYLSGHFKSFLDACFETMSGFATTGLTLCQDMDHLPYAHQFWRHVTMFLGGQGIVIVALSFFVKGSSGAFKMYVGEARDERVLPNVISTSRFIWLVSLVYLALGTVTLGSIGLLNGMRAHNAFFHGACVFMAAFDTGGFTPQSQNILYYHSFAYEVATIVCMLLGSINFKLHYQVWTGNRKELFKNIESSALFVSISLLFILVAAGLERSGTYSSAITLFRKGFYQLVSGHTGTGFQTIYAQQFVNEWSDLSLVAVVFAMGLGGAICSTTGGIKMLRLGIIYKALREDIKRIILPEKAVVVQKFHHIKDIFLEDKQVRSALLITVCYFLLYIVGALVGMIFHYPFLDALFESTSAAANVGLSCGITAPGMHPLLKLTYIFQMWAGRLEFMSVFALAGFFVAAVKGK